MSTDRRSFLRGLAALPLIGGGLTLIGSPTAAAVPVTNALHARYLGWLQHEHWAALREFNRREAIAHWRPSPTAYEATAEAYADRAATYCPAPSWWMTDAPDIERSVAAALPSSRAAVILSAAGVPL